MTSKSVKGFCSCSSSRSHCPLRGASSPRSSPMGVRLGTPRPLRLHQPPQGGSISPQTSTWVGPCLLKHAPVGGPVPSDSPRVGPCPPRHPTRVGPCPFRHPPRVGPCPVRYPPGGIMSPQIPTRVGPCPLRYPWGDYVPSDTHQGGALSPQTPTRVGPCPFRHPP